MNVPPTANDVPKWTEAERLAALDRYAILDTPAEESFDNIVQMVAMLLNAPIAAINLIGTNRQWFKSEIGLGVREMPLDDSICAKIILQPDDPVVPDMRADPRFNCNPLVTVEPGLRFYAGELLITPDGYPLGTLCVLDTKPRQEGLCSKQRFMLKTLAEQVMAQLELRRAVRQREDLLLEQHRQHSLNQQILNSATDYAIISFDLQGKLLSWNSGAQQVFGWTEDEMAGQSMDRLFTPEDAAEGVPQADRSIALQCGRALHERWHVRKDGERFWASGGVTPLRNDRNDCTGFVQVLRNSTRQKQIESELHALNQTLEAQVAERTRERDALWKNSTDIFLVLDTEGIVFAVNPAWTATLGHAPEDIIGHNFSIFLHPEDVNQTLVMLVECAHRPLAHFENRYRHKDGSYRWLAWTTAPDNGRIYGNARDITDEKRQAEHQQMATEARLHLALDAGHMGAWQWDVNTNLAMWMHGTATLHGEPAASRLRFPLQEYLDYVHPEDRDDLVQALQQTVADRTEFRIEYRVVWSDQSVHWLEGRGKLLFNDANEPIEMVGVTMDISQRKIAEQNLRFLAQASAELARLQDPQSTLSKVAFVAVPAFADWCIVDLLDDKGTSLNRVTTVHANPAKMELVRELGRRFPPEKNLRYGAWNVVRTQRPELIEEITDEILVQAIQHEEYRLRLKALGVKSYIGAPLIAHGKVLGVISFFNAESGRTYGPAELALAEDLARRIGVAIENMHLYEAIRRSDQGKDVFLATLAHELRNPLAAVSNALSIANLAADDTKRVRQATKIIGRQVTHLTRLVDDLMDISRIATGKIELRKEVTSLATILANAIETSRAHIEASNHELNLRLPSSATTILADPIRLTQVFANLLNNAAKYTDPKGRIDVILESTPEELVVRIKDTGIGIPPAMLKNIFAIFAQLEHPIERRGGGLGIGLSLVEGLVKMHGGKVEALSEGPGKGSEFIVHLPRHKEQPDSSEHWTGTAPDGVMQQRAPRRILVVDDNTDAANTLSEILQMLGYDVTAVVHDGLAGVDAAVQTQPDIVLLDIGLPRMDGYAVAKTIRAHEELKHVVLVALTGWGHDKDKQMARDAGFDHHLVKPVRIEQLQAILTAV